MTTEQIIQEVQSKLGFYSLSSFHRDRRRFEIKPLGVRQKPQVYPDAAVATILHGRGLEGYLATMRVPKAPNGNQSKRLELITGPALRRIKRNGRKQ